MSGLSRGGAGWKPAVSLVGAAMLLPLLTADGFSSTAEAIIPTALRQFLGTAEDVRIDGLALDGPGLRRFYRARGFAPAWDPDDGGAERAAALITALARAEDHGLDPGDYHLDGIRSRLAPSGERAAAESELLLTDAFLRYATHVRSGRLRPEEVEPDWGIAPARFDPGTALARAIEEPRTFQARLDSLPPPAEGYRRLVEALRDYRALAALGAWPVVPAGPSLEPRQRDARVPTLRRRLAAEDRVVVRAAGTDYDVELDRAVRRFQARHGLVVDGIVGSATLRELNVPAGERVRQIGLNLERWRWLPRDLAPGRIAVNAADATLQVVAEGRVVLRSRVVVGDLQHPTPVAQARLDAIILNPPWNVPASIAGAEILPLLRMNPRYLADNDIVILDRQATDPFGRAVDWSAVPAQPFPFRLQQRPGPKNPLGRIKFDIPNRFDVYLHDTPARSLFARPVRTASHGCIRVERALDLAAYVLDLEPEPWNRSMLEEAIAAGRGQQIRLHRSLPVYILYWTAFVGEDGALQFREDVYGRDQRLAAALRTGAGTAGQHPGQVVGGCRPPDREAAR